MWDFKCLYIVHTHIFVCIYGCIYIFLYRCVSQFKKAMGENLPARLSVRSVTKIMSPGQVKVHIHEVSTKERDPILPY